MWTIARRLLLCVFAFGVDAVAIYGFWNRADYKSVSVTTLVFSLFGSIATALVAVNRADAYAGKGKRYAHTSRPDGRRDPRTVIRWINDARQGGTKVVGGPPYQKPQSMTRALLEALCSPEGLALEACCGAAPLARAAKHIGRRCVSVDNHKPYINAARRALAKEE